MPSRHASGWIIKATETMHEVFVNDKEKHRIIRSISPHNDVDCDPYEYFNLNYAYFMYRKISDLLSLQKGETIPDGVIKNYVQHEVDKIITDKLNTTKPNPIIHELFTNDALDKHKQTSLLK